MQTDTTDILLLAGLQTVRIRETLLNIVNEINFGKDATISVADDSIGEYMHPDINSIDSISCSHLHQPNNLDLVLLFNLLITNANAIRS